MDAIVSKYPDLQALPEVWAHVRQAYATSEDAVTTVLEVLKFLGILALIMATALIMLMLG